MMKISFFYLEHFKDHNLENQKTILNYEFHI